MSAFITIEELLSAKEGEQFQFKEAKNRFDFSGSICDRARLSDLDASAIEAFRTKWIARIKTTG
jgi:hypothetical protein